MKILLLGKNGQVGWELQRALACVGELVALDARSDGWCGDLTRLDGLAATVKAIRPNIIVNAAAYTAVDLAETEQDKAFLINAAAPGMLAREAAKLGALLVHFSTDYVFDGSGAEPWLETDQTSPLNVYGHSKLAGEMEIVASGCEYLIFRTSWVYARRGRNFLKTIYRLAQQREILNVVDDQIGAPTGAELLADVTAHALTRYASKLSGIYHLTATGCVSWCGFAQMVIDEMRQQGGGCIVEQLNAVSSAAFPSAARRPLNSRLSVQKIERLFDFVLPSWDVGVRRVLAELSEA